MIAQRYYENLMYLQRILFSTKEISTADKPDIYGFNKFIIGLSQQGKLFCLSALDGTLQWTSSLFAHNPVKLFLRN
jgi:hypothetical protein